MRGSAHTTAGDGRAARASHASAGHYRPDIDGLRALAVLTVVGFHAFPDRVPGGFIGVDIFFVISGYLISTILFTQLEQERFSFVDFYVRRVRRIFPALIAVLAASLALGWLVLLQAEFRQLGLHVAGGAGFVANLLLWRESGYFDHAAETKPLLHLWSLGIEEQFYLGWPPLLVLAWSWRRNLLWVALAVAILSFGWNVARVKADFVGNFYSPQSRIWELMVGGMLAWVDLHASARRWRDGARQIVLGRMAIRPATVLSWLGIGLIAYGLAVLDKDAYYPGVWGLLPTLGAALVIAAGPQAWPNRVAFTHPWAVWIGLISYPLYLWHWPLLSYARILHNGTPPVLVRAGAAVLAVMLAWLTWRFLERPLRFGGSGRRKAVVLGLTMAVLAAAGAAIYADDGVPGRRAVQANAVPGPLAANSYGGDVVEHCRVADPRSDSVLESCLQDRREDPVYAVVGDSKAGALAPALFRTSLPGGRWLQLSSSGNHNAPVPVLSGSEAYRRFQPGLEIVLRDLDAAPGIRTVVFVAATRNVFLLHNDSDIEDLPASPNYPLALEGLEHTVEHLVRAGKQVVLLVDNPTLPHPEDCAERRTGFSWLDRALTRRNPRCDLPLAEHLRLSAQYRKLLGAVQQHHPDRVRIFDTAPLLCDEKAGVCSSLLDGQPAYGVSDHVSDFAAERVASALNRFLQER